ncbi:MAG: hypothetical protein ACM3PW_17525 [Chlamydiota bacterium]
MLTAKSNENQTLLLKQEMSQEEYCRRFIEDENVKVIGSAPSRSQGNAPAGRRLRLPSGLP